MEQIYITDVSPRDGLQNQPGHVSTNSKVRLINLLIQAGVSSIEATSFVSPKSVPQMSDSIYVMEALNSNQPDYRFSALVPNSFGLNRAQSVHTKEISVVLSATETMNQRNINMSLDAATEACRSTLSTAINYGMSTRAYIAVAFECPFEGNVSFDVVADLAETMLKAGANEIVIADTNGAASPGMVKRRLSDLANVIPLHQMGVHFHDTRGMAVANAWAALEVGVRRFDSSVGGIGGCPFAPGAAGNLATEDLVLMAERSNYSTGIDIKKLLDVIDFAETELQKPLGGGSIAWLRRQRNGSSFTC